MAASAQECLSASGGAHKRLWEPAPAVAVLARRSALRSGRRRNYDSLFHARGPDPTTHAHARTAHHPSPAARRPGPPGTCKIGKIRDRLISVRLSLALAAGRGGIEKGCRNVVASCSPTESFWEDLWRAGANFREFSDNGGQKDTGSASRQPRRCTEGVGVSAGARGESDVNRPQNRVSRFHLFW